MPARDAATPGTALLASIASAQASSTAVEAPAGDAPREVGLNGIPPVACEPGSYVQFVNAFARFASQRPRFVTDAGRAQLDGFDFALVDHRWQRESDGVALEVEINRRGSRLDVSATPVERDAEDNPVRTLGPTRHCVFEHSGGCWRYAGQG